MLIPLMLQHEEGSAAYLALEEFVKDGEHDSDHRI